MSVNLINPNVNCGFSISNCFVLDVDVATVVVSFLVVLPPQATNKIAVDKTKVDFLNRDFICSKF